MAEEDEGKQGDLKFYQNQPYDMEVDLNNEEDGEENDYQYMGDLVYTDGTSVASTEFMYSIDKEYGNGEDVEAEMKAVTGHYGIDYEKLNWTEVKSPSK